MAVGYIQQIPQPRLTTSLHIATMSRTGYANGNPVSYLDPFGMSALGDYFEGVGQVFEGYGLAVRDTAVGLYNVAAHPVNTAVGLYNVAANPVQSYNAISTSIANTWNSGLTGQGEVVGNILIAAASVGGGEAIASTRTAQIVGDESQFGAFAVDTENMSQSQVLSQWETGSMALNNADYEALGGSGTSALFKAPYIDAWVDTEGNPLTTTLADQYSTGAQIFMQGSGLTPNAYLGLGYIVPSTSALGNLGAAGSTISSSTGK